MLPKPKTKPALELQNFKFEKVTFEELFGKQSGKKSESAFSRQISQTKKLPLGCKICTGPNLDKKRTIGESQDQKNLQKMNQAMAAKRGRDDSKNSFTDGKYRKLSQAARELVKEGQRSMKDMATLRTKILPKYTSKNGDLGPESRFNKYEYTYRQRSKVKNFLPSIMTNAYRTDQNSF